MIVTVAVRKLITSFRTPFQNDGDGSSFESLDRKSNYLIAFSTKSSMFWPRGSLKTNKVSTEPVDACYLNRGPLFLQNTLPNADRFH